MNIIYLTDEGKKAQNECIAELYKAELAINNCIDQLRQTKGIGAEFLIEGLQNKVDKISERRRRMKNIPGG